MQGLHAYTNRAVLLCAGLLVVFISVFTHLAGATQVTSGWASGNIPAPTLADELPPAPADANAITVSDPVNGIVSITGDFGSVEADSSVSLVNYETGATSEVTANAEGGFSADLTAQDQHVFGLTVIDAAGNPSLPISLGVGEILTLTVASPVEGASIGDDRVLVTGTFSGPLNTSVSVNGIVACTQGTAYFASDVPLVAGANTLEVSVQMADGLTFSQTLTVTSTGTAPMRSRIDSPCGLAPHSTQLVVESATATAMTEVELDIDNDGIVDALLPDSALPYEFSYTTPGSYQAAVTVHDADGVAHQFVHPIYVADVVDIDQILRDSYTGMLNRLTHGAIEGALNKVSGGVYEKYQGIFTTLQTELPTVVSQLGTLYTGEIGAGMAEYFVVRSTDTVQNGYFIYFLRGEDGLWRIDGM